MINDFITSFFGDVAVPDVLLATVVFYIFAFAFEGIIDIIKSLLKAGRF